MGRNSIGKKPPIPKVWGTLFSRAGLGFLLVLASVSCGYKAADSDDLEARQGEFVGVLVDSKGTSHPDALVELFDAKGTTLLLSNNMDSDGRFSLFPPAPGFYNVIGVLGDTEKVIYQNIELNEALDGINLGTIQGQTVAVLSVHVTEPAGTDAQGVSVQVLGTDATAETVEEGAGLIAGVPAGTYTVRFSKAGYTAFEQTVVLSSGGTLLLDNVKLTAE